MATGGMCKTKMLTCSTSHRVVGPNKTKKNNRRRAQRNSGCKCIERTGLSKCGSLRTTVPNSNFSYRSKVNSKSLSSP